MTVHIVGGGLAGLATATALAAEGQPCVVYEAAGQLGGRCRATWDPTLARVIDNGNHLVLSGNATTLRYLATIGASDELVAPAGDGFRFVDLAKGLDFQLRPNPGPVPWWILSRSRRVPATRALDYLALARLALAGPDATIAGVTPANELYRSLIEPLAIAALNTPATEGSARALWAVVRGTLARGGRYARPLIARHDLTSTFVTPAEAYLAARGVTICRNARVRSLETAGGRVVSLQLADAPVVLGTTDSVVLAVPPAIAARLIPGLVVPVIDEPIVNAHFAVPHDGCSHAITGIVGGTAHWVFRRDGLASVTVSAARDLVDLPADELAPRLWADVVRVHAECTGPMPAYRVIKEKRATIRQSPADERLRPDTRTGLANLWLAGDWTRTGLPASIEGSLRSGLRAATLALGGGR